MAALHEQTTVTASAWGRTALGDPVERYTLRSGALRVELCSHGARVLSVTMLNLENDGTDVLLGFGTLAEYEADRDTYMGATVGRFANRIASGQFILDGRRYQVPVNNGTNALHGGPEGFDHKVWRACTVPQGVEFSLRSPDGDMGFPGDLQVSVRYTLHQHALHMEYIAETDRPTVVNLTNHAYFNLAGNGLGSILDHELRIDADSVTPLLPTLVPTGELLSVQDTPFDFRRPAIIGRMLQEGGEQIGIARGFDHNFVLNGSGLREVARAIDPQSGRTLVVETTAPGLQFYSGNFLDGSVRSAHGVPYQQRAGFCLETQHFPDSPNQPSFPSTHLDPSVRWSSTTIYRFEQGVPQPA